MSKALFDFEMRPAVLFSLMMMLLIACAWAIWLHYQQFDRITTMESTIQELQSQQFDRIVTIESNTQKQTELLKAALGSALPVKMPPEWEDRLEGLEAIASDPDAWPKDASQAQEFMDRLSELTLELSPLSESRYFSRLLLVRWSAVAFDGLYRVPTADGSIEDFADQLRAIADANPESGDTELSQRLRERANEFANKIEAQFIEETIRQARTYLASENTTRKDLLAQDTSIGEVDEILAIYENHPQRGEEIKELRTSLQRHMAIRDAQSQAAALTDQWHKAKALASSQEAVYEAAAIMLLREVSAARVALALQGLRQPMYESLEHELRGAVEVIHDENRRGYQKWALERILMFERRYGAISDRAAQDAKMFSIDNGGWNEERFREVQDAMTTFLLPIDQSLLDLPVLKRYHREFDEGWNRLDGRKEQTNVAISSSRTPKQSLYDTR